MLPPSEFTAAFRAALAGGDLPSGVTAQRASEAAQRFAVYRNNVAHSLKTALARRFPVIERLVGAEFFAAMASEFIAAQPPRNPVLAEWGDGFAGWLAGFPPVAGLPYLPDVARLEWARGQAYHAADATPIDPATLPGRDRLRLHPSLRLLHLNYPAVSIWAANQPDHDGRCTATGPEIALIWRSPDFDVPVHAVSPADAALIADLQADQPLAEATGDHDPTTMLALLLRNALICEEELT